MLLAWGYVTCFKLTTRVLVLCTRLNNIYIIKYVCTSFFSSDGMWYVFAHQKLPLPLDVHQINGLCHVKGSDMLLGMAGVNLLLWYVVYNKTHNLYLYK